MNPFLFGNPASVGQQTRAAQIIIGGAAGNGMQRRKVRRKKPRAAARKAATRVARKPRARKARLVKGSAAAKRYMASIRRKRRK